MLQLDSGSRGGFRARVLKSRFGEATVKFDLPLLQDAELGGISGTVRGAVHRSIDPAFETRPPLEVGTDLFRSVFQGQVRTLFDKSRGQLEMSPDLGLRLKIKIDPNDEDAGALADLPWELLCDPETEDFFALSRQVSLVRYLDVPRPSQPIPFTPPLRILAVGASPRGVDPLDLAEEAERLKGLNGGSSGVEVHVVLGATVAKVREALSKDAWNVLHFMGHGTFDTVTGEGMLALEKADGSLDLVSGKAFANKLKDVPSLGVVVLNACETARALHEGGANPFRGVATALVLGGLPAVVAMRLPISDDAAIAFSTAFYGHLAGGESIDVALTEGRQAIHSNEADGFEWATPVLFLRTPKGNVFEAKPAERQKVVERPAPEPPPMPAPIVPKRGSALRIAAGVAGAGLVSLFLYNQLPSDPPVQEQERDTVVEPTPTPPFEAEPTPEPTPRRKIRDPRTEPEPQHQEVATALPVATPTPPPPAQVEEAPVQSADLSNLSALADSIELRDAGGLRVTVTFRNQAALPLSAALDGEGSTLSDEQGRRYNILKSSLSAWRLELAPGASSRHTFDFQAPKLNSSKFLLALRAEDGSPIRLTGASLTLEGPP